MAKPKPEEIYAVIGYMDSYGSVHSVVEMMDDDVVGRLHHELFADKPHVRLKWRYDPKLGELCWQTASYEPTDDESNLVMNHLYRMIDDTRNYL